MGLSIGLVGLPNVGKSTLFNALTKEQMALAANYPFATVEPNKAIVPVPDHELDALAALVESKETIYATVEFVDVAGLVKGASQGEGMGNKFLGNIRDVDAILHVVRCFEDPNVVHVSTQPDPKDDIEVINTELALADLDQIEKRIERLSRSIKGDPKLKPQLEMAQKIADYLGTGAPLWAFPEKDSEHYQAINKEVRFLTAKPVIYAANVDEMSIDDGNEYVDAAREVADAQGAPVIMICAKLEAEMAGLDDEDQQEILDMYGLTENSLDKLIRAGYDMLGLMSFYTFNHKESHAWTIQRGWKAPRAAGVIHTDIEQGFIRAEVIPYDAIMAHKTRVAVKEAGAMRIEGKEYIVNERDILNFLHSN